MRDLSAQDNTLSAPPSLRHMGRWRRRLVSACLRRLLAATEQRLCTPGQLPSRGIRRVLLCGPGYHRDEALLISPLLAEIETLYPSAETDVVAGCNSNEDLFTHRFQVGRFYHLPRNFTRRPWATIGLLRQLRRDTYDLAIDPCPDSQPARLLLAFARARFKLGYPAAWGPAATTWDEVHLPTHLAQRSVSLLRAAYAERISAPCPPLDLRLQKAETDRARKALKDVLGGMEQSRCTRTVVGIFVEAAGAKRYGSDWWERFIDNLVAGLPDVCIVNLVAEPVESQLDQRFASYCTREPRHLAAVIACMDAFISADRGAMYLAAASGTPTMGLFSTSGSSARYGPYGPLHEAIDTDALSAEDVAAIASDWLKLTPAGDPGLRDGP